MSNFRKIETELERLVMDTLAKHGKMTISDLHNLIMGKGFEQKIMAKVVYGLMDKTLLSGHCPTDQSNGEYSFSVFTDAEFKEFMSNIKIVMQ